MNAPLRGGLRRGLLSLAVAAVMAMPAWPQAPQGPQDLGSKSIEDLMNIEVTSVSKKEQKLSHIAAAIFVITQADIQHSGATNIPDVLRMVPGLDVAQINGSTWEISARGLNSQLADKLLVLIDGRTVYSPLFAGVYWDVQDVPLEDVDRIEVIRGPGAAVWGANAVNGVINIITKSAKETQGGLVTAGGGTHESALGLAQYGGKIGQQTSYRVFTEGYDYSAYPSLTGQYGYDGYDLLHGGFRVDSTLSPKDSLTVQGDLYEGHDQALFNIVSLTPPYASTKALTIGLSGGDILGRWNHTFSPHSDTSLQVYYDSTERNSDFEGESVSTVDIDFQHHFGWGSRQDFVWGLGYRYVSYSTTGSLTASFHPPGQDLQLFTSFVQDEITLKPDRLFLTIGTKFEHNDFTGFEFEPSVRIAWSVSKNHMVWAAYSRARRTPSPVERGVKFSQEAFAGPGGVPILVTAEGDPNTVDENLDAYEAGYRTQLRSNLSVDLAIYYNQYLDLTTYEPGMPYLQLNPAPPHVVDPIYFANKLGGETHGIEMAVNWKLTNRWTISPGYAFERIHMRTEPGSQDTASAAAAKGGTPHVQAQLRSTLALTSWLEWDASAYFVDRLEAQPVPSYTRLDSGLTWRASEHLAFSVVGQNLLQNVHVEADSPSQSELSSLIKRSVYAKITWQF